MATSRSTDPTVTLLRTLDPEMQWRAAVLINAIRDAGFPAIITSARRTPEEQRELVDRGRSLTLNSKHLDGLAFDIDVAGIPRDDIPLWWWNEVGPWAEKWLGLTWGGRWTSIRDYGHFELRRI